MLRSIFSVAITALAVHTLQPLIFRVYTNAVTQLVLVQRRGATSLWYVLEP